MRLVCVIDYINYTYFRVFGKCNRFLARIIYNLVKHNGENPVEWNLKKIRNW